jgi:hypothetical protein
LNELECYADKEQLLKLLGAKSAVAEADNEGGDETTTGHYNIENIPSVGTETAPTEAKASNEDIDEVYRHQHKEKVI